MGLKNTPIEVIFPVANVVSNQAAKQTLTFPMPIGWNYIEEDLITSGGLTLAMISEIREFTNDVLTKRWGGSGSAGGTDLDAMNQYFGAPAALQASTNLILTIFQRRLGIRGGIQSLTTMDKNGKALPVDKILLTSGSAKDLAEECTYNTGSYDKSNLGIAKATIEVDLINTPVGSPTLKVLGRATDKFDGGAGVMKYVDLKILPVVATSQFTLDKQSGLQIGDLKHTLFDHLVLVPAAGTLDSFVVYYQNNIIFNRTDEVNRKTQQNDKIRFPQAGYYMIDYTERGYGDEDLYIAPSDTQMSVLFTPSNTTSVKAYQVSMGNLYPVAS